MNDMEDNETGALADLTDAEVGSVGCCFAIPLLLVCFGVFFYVWYWIW